MLAELWRACVHLCVCVFPVLWQRCRGERWLCCSRNDCLYSTVLLPIVAKNNPAPQDRMEGSFFLLLFSPLTHYPPFLAQSNFSSPSFIIYTLTFPLWLFFSVSSLSPALGLSENRPVIMQAQLSASTLVARTGRVFLQLNIIGGFKYRALFLSPCVLRVCCWTLCCFCRTTERPVFCRRKQATWKQPMGFIFQHTQRGVHIFRALNRSEYFFSALGRLCPPAIPTVEM